MAYRGNVLLFTGYGVSFYGQLIYSNLLFNIVPIGRYMIYFKYILIWKSLYFRYAHERTLESIECIYYKDCSNDNLGIIRYPSKLIKFYTMKM